MPRSNGFVPIEDYAVLGDGRTIALVSRDGRLDWWPAPALDSPPVLAALLDPQHGGYLSVTPDGPFESDRRYLPDTNVLEVAYRTPSGEAVVTQALNSGSAGRLPWTEIAIRLEGRTGTTRLRWELVPGNRFGQAKPWLTTFRSVPVVKVGDQYLAVIADGLPQVPAGDSCLTSTVEVGAGDRKILAVAATDAEPLFLPAPAAVDRRLDHTIDSWRRWASLVRAEGPWRDQVLRSALVLKALVAEETGAIAAAGTTSLPERVGGDKNWDYRYAWVRDSSFVVDAMLELGLHEEVHGAVSWLLKAIKRNGGDLHVFYSLGGGVAELETDLDAPGYRGSRPVRMGNSAADQVQLGTYGDLFDTMWRYCRAGHLLDDETAHVLAGMANSCSDRWMSRDSGIWELNQLEHYTISKIGCWVALDRAVQLGEAGQISNRNLERWQQEREEIRQWVDAHCWSEAKQAYTFYGGTERLDAAVLLAGRTGFDRGPRLASTIEAVRQELARGPYVYRYSGAEHEEGAFVACSFWLVEALAHTGQLDRGRDLMDDCLKLVNDLGVLAEQIEPATGAFLGNVPQALSHLALLNAAFALMRPVEAVSGQEAEGTN